MELGPDILVLVTPLQEMDPLGLQALIRNPAGTPTEVLAGASSGSSVPKSFG
jgi:hypothetical protein